MVNIRMLGLASALAILLPAAAYALPGLWPDPNDPASLVVQGGADQHAFVSNVTSLYIPNPSVVDGNTTSSHEQLVEGHTTFVTIDMQSRETPQAQTNVSIQAYAQCALEVSQQVSWWDNLVPYPSGVDTGALDCLENATLVVVPDPASTSSTSTRSPLSPDGRLLRYATPTGEVGYETEYTFLEDGATRYAWGVQAARVPWQDATGATKNLVAILPEDLLAQMGVHSFHVVDARTLPMSP